MPTTDRGGSTKQSKHTTGFLLSPTLRKPCDQKKLHYPFIFHLFPNMHQALPNAGRTQKTLILPRADSWLWCFAQVQHHLQWPKAMRVQKHVASWREMVELLLLVVPGTWNTLNCTAIFGLTSTSREGKTDIHAGRTSTVTFQTTSLPKFLLLQQAG